MSDQIEEQVDRVAEAIAKAADADYWTDEIAEWECAEEWEREAHPDEYPGMAYEDREQFRTQARAALAAAGVAPQSEPKYEYGPGYKEANGRWFSLDGAFTVREAAEHSLNNYADDPQVHLLRRVKAGAWEPVPNQSDGSES